MFANLSKSKVKYATNQVGVWMGDSLRVGPLTVTRNCVAVPDAALIPYRLHRLRNATLICEFICRAFSPSAPSATSCGRSIGTSPQRKHCTVVCLDSQQLRRCWWGDSPRHHPKHGLESQHLQVLQAVWQRGRPRWSLNPSPLGPTQDHPRGGEGAASPCSMSRST